MSHADSRLDVLLIWATVRLYVLYCPFFVIIQRTSAGCCIIYRDFESPSPLRLLGRSGVMSAPLHTAQGQAYVLQNSAYVHGCIFAYG